MKLRILNHDIRKCIMLMGLFILMVCVSLICYSCNYYMKLHAREIGMLKMAGFNQGKVVLYQLIQMIMLMIVSVIITCCLSLVTTPIFLTVVYRYCHIHQSIFYFNTRLFSMIGILVVCILIVLIGMQVNYINNNSLSSLIKDKYITTQKEDHRVFVIPDYIYILGYFLGLYAMYVGEELNAPCFCEPCGSKMKSNVSKLLMIFWISGVLGSFRSGNLFGYSSSRISFSESITASSIGALKYI